MTNDFKEVLAERLGDSSFGADGYLAIKGNSVNFREKPSTSAKVIMVLNNGQPVVAIHPDDAPVEADGHQWGDYTYNGVPGWIAEEYVEYKSGAAPIPSIPQGTVPPAKPGVPPVAPRPIPNVLNKTKAMGAWGWFAGVAAVLGIGGLYLAEKNKDR